MKSLFHCFVVGILMGIVTLFFVSKTVYHGAKIYALKQLSSGRDISGSSARFLTTPWRRGLPNSATAASKGLKIPYALRAWDDEERASRLG